MVLLGVEALPRGGTLSLRIHEAPPRIVVTAAGTDARLTDEVRAALAEAADVESLTPRTVHAYFTGRLAEALGSPLRISPPGSEPVEITASFEASPV